MPQKYVLLCSFEIFHWIYGVEMLKAFFPHSLQHAW